MEHGATHFTHWFQPLTGMTAEKHDSFYAPTGDGNAIAEFSGKELIQGEPDASSFPTGGIRATFEARGYTAWDPTSPAFILENPNGAVLCIPTAFASWTGEALDHKIPLLRSMDALSSTALRALKLFGDADVLARVHHGRARAGVLPDRRAVLLRAPRPHHHRPHAVRRQAAEGPRARRPLLRVDPRARAGLHARDRAAARPARRADQDAPQRGRAGAVRGRADLRELQRRLRPPAAHDAGDAERRPPLRARLPAAREAVRRRQRLRQAQQLVDGHRHRPQPARAGRHAAREPAVPVLLRGGASRRSTSTRSCCARRSPTPGQDHRLGANEAPPAIISIFLGAELEKVFGAIESGSGDAATPQSYLELGASVLPSLPMHGGDRNRTSPFAFTGNKFEFRALGLVDVAGAPEHGPQHDRRRGDRRADRRASRRPAGDGKSLEEAVLDVVKRRLVEPQADRLLRRQLLRRLARRGRAARAGEPAPDARRAAVADRAEHRRGVLQVRGALRARARVALRGVRRAVRDHDQHRGRDGGVDRPHDAAAGGGPVVRHARGGRHGRRRPAAQGRARRPDRRVRRGDLRARDRQPGPPGGRRRRSTRPSTSRAEVLPAMAATRESPTGSSGSCRTTSGRCRSTRRSSSSSNRTPPRVLGQ